MNTKVEEALGVLERAADDDSSAGYDGLATQMNEARATLAAHIAQQDAQLHEAWSRMDNAEARAKAAESRIAKQDATIARMREALTDCSDKLRHYFKAHGPEYVGGIEYSQMQFIISTALKDSP